MGQSNMWSLKLYSHGSSLLNEVRIKIAVKMSPGTPLLLLRESLIPTEHATPSRLPKAPALPKSYAADQKVEM